MHVEEVDRDRQREDDRQRHKEDGQRQACTWKTWTETDRGRMTVRDIWRVDRDRNIKDYIQRHMDGGQ
jgi:hypothetical protein